MSSIEFLSQVLKLFGWLILIFAVLSLGLTSLSWILILSTINKISSGVVYLGIAYGLEKKEKWTYYTGLVIFTVSILINILVGSLTGFSNTLLLSILIEIAYIGLLFYGKQLFIGPPKEEISQWIRKPYFALVVAGFIISNLIYIGVSFYINSKK